MSQSASSAAAPPSISEKATRPDVLWVNHKDQILIKVVVARACDVQCTFDKKAFTVICKSKESGSKIYGVSHGLFAPVDAARCSFEVLADCIDLRLQKMGTKVQSADEWPRLTTEAIKSPKIQIDWERADVGECTDSNRAAKLAAKKADFESTAEQFEAYEAFQQNAPNVLKEIKNIYLTTFNAMMGGFWFISLVLMVDLLSESNWDWALASLSAWQKVGHWVVILQVLSTLEIFHNAIGLVPGGLLGAIALHAGRDMVLFGAMQAVDAPEVRQSPFLLVIFIGWSTTEIVRYAFYALNVQQVCPYVVKWMRYTFPLLVFPFVSYTEVYVEYLALPFVRERQLMSSPPMPNALNFEVHGSAILMVAMAVHALATPMLFAYLLQNRNKALGPSKEEKAAVAATAAGAATTKSKRA